MVLGGAYFLAGSGKFPIFTPAATQPTSQVTESDLEFVTDATLRKYLLAQANVAKIRVQSKSSGKGEIIDITESDVNDSNTYRILKVNDLTKQEVAQLISVGNVIYVKDYTDNTWWKQTLTTGEGPTPTEVQAADIKEQLAKEDFTTYKNLGQEACEGLTCYKYEQAIRDAPGSARTFWFDTKEYLLRKEIYFYGEFTNQLDYSYDGINIIAPSPTKEVPEGVDIDSYLPQ